MQLPRAPHNDVAFELRALTHDGLQERADAAGQPVAEANGLLLQNPVDHGSLAEAAARNAVHV